MSRVGDRSLLRVRDVGRITTTLLSIALLSPGLFGCDDSSATANDGEAPLEDVRIADFGRDPDAGPDPADAHTQDGMPEDAAPPEPDTTVGPEDLGPLEPLSLNSVIPNRSVTTGGAEFRVIGSGFGPGLSIRLGDVACGALQIESPNHVRCVSPPAAAGRVDVVARMPGRDGERPPEAVIEGGFTFFEAVSVTAVRPPRVPVRGRVRVAIEGTGLIEGSRVDLGDVRLDAPTLTEDGTLEVVVPPGEPGPVDVTVSNFNGTATLPGGLFYYEDVIISRIDPPVGPLAGGVRTGIFGVGLTRESRVTFGVAGAEVQEAGADRRSLSVNSPRGANPGPVDVVVENENGTATASGAYVYFDEAAQGFSVAGLAPPAGPVEGGNDVFVAGAGFTAGTRVEFDEREISCQRESANVLRCTVPAGEVGPVDVAVIEGGERVDLPEGYVYFQTLDLLAIYPDRGSIAGGTVVTLSGTGFVPEMVVELGGAPVTELVVTDERTATARTPANPVGPVDVVASTRFSRSVIPAGFTYFNPTTQFGGVWGGPIDGALNITVLDGGSGGPVDDAIVVGFFEGGDVTLEGRTSETGHLTLSMPGLRGPANVTAAKEGYEVTTIEDVEAENVTIYLIPNDGEGDPPPGVPAAILRGVASGLDALPKPVNERYLNVIVIETTHSSPYNRPQLPPPGPGGLLTEDGPFEIIARPGELAIIATAGEIDRDVLKAYQDGELAYWTMRQSLNPLAMGIRRFIAASPGIEINGLQVEIDHPMTLAIPTDLDNPPAGPDPGPLFYAVLPRLDLGPEGYWELDTQAVSLTPEMVLRQMPRLDGWDADLRYYLIGLAVSNTPDNQPMAVTIERTRDVAAGVFIGPFVGSPFILGPGVGGALGLERRVTWGVHDGFYGPITPPSANMVLIEEPALGPPKPLWRYVTPSLITEFEVPVLPADVGTAGLGGGMMFLTILPFLVEGRFDFDDFSYDELNQFRWKSWGTSSSTFTQ